MDHVFGEFGDCEIRTIAFDHPNVFIKLFDATGGEFYVLVFSEISLMRMDCDHAQVVLDKFVVFNNITEAKSAKLFQETCENLKIDVNSPQLANRKISILAGIVGGDIFIASENVLQKKD